MHHNPEDEISKQLYKLRKYSLNKNTENKKNIYKFAKYVAAIHSQNIDKNNFKIYDGKWVTKQIHKINDIHKEDIILALENMSQIEAHNATLKNFKFLAWDIVRSDWQKDYQSGNIGSFVWDIACIINFANNPKCSEIFLESYLKHGGNKPSLTALYANVYYIQVFEALKTKEFENLRKTTRKIIEDATFQTDIISYETLVKLNIIGYS